MRTGDLFLAQIFFSYCFYYCGGRKVEDAPDGAIAATAALHRALLATRYNLSQGFVLLISHVLSTLVLHRCARIAELLTAFACWENGLTLECQDAASGLFADKSSSSVSLQKEEARSADATDDATAGRAVLGRTPSSTSPLESNKVRPVLSAEEKQRILAALPKEVHRFFQLIIILSLSVITVFCCGCAFRLPRL